MTNSILNYQVMDNISIVGGVRYSNIGRELYNNEESKDQAEFLVELQSIMMMYGVTKIDACIDAFGSANNETGL